ncbi:hypothetical protein N566_11665 [Streptomycetaceae bacterium MP113-05]|nr:hypothetical protein N566_11665 [Streptomycetaceae bacterium MP113-05]
MTVRPRRVLGTRKAAVAACAVLAAAGAALAPAAPAGAVLPPVRDHLVLTVTDSGYRAHDGRFELLCHPAGGDHRRAKEACARLDEVTVWGSDPFAPVPPDSVCTSLYGGPATAHLEGMWAGRPVNADFGRATGCETARWNDLVPLLPRTRL